VAVGCRVTTEVLAMTALELDEESRLCW